MKGEGEEVKGEDRQSIGLVGDGSGGSRRLMEVHC